MQIAFHILLKTVAPLIILRPYESNSTIPVSNLLLLLCNFAYHLLFFFLCSSCHSKSRISGKRKSLKSIFSSIFRRKTCFVNAWCNIEVLFLGNHLTSNACLRHFVLNIVTLLLCDITQSNQNTQTSHSHYWNQCNLLISSGGSSHMSAEDKCP